MKSGAIALRIVGSLAMSSRERLIALRAMYSACTPSRCAVAAASSALVSSWNSASITVRIAIAPMHHDERDAALLRAPLARGGVRARLRRLAVRQPRHCMIPKLRGCCIGIMTFVDVS